MPPPKYRDRNTIVSILRKAGEFADEHSAEEFTVNQLANECKCGVRFLNHSFLAVFGYNARSFIQRYRAAILRNKIKNQPHENLGRLAGQCGMRLTPTEKRVFLSIYEISIDEYQEECRQESGIEAPDTIDDQRIRALDWIEEAIRLRKVDASATYRTRRTITEARDTDRRAVG
jgi:AraC-like DNA-binding protein